MADKDGKKAKDGTTVVKEASGTGKPQETEGKDNASLAGEISNDDLELANEINRLYDETLGKGGLRIGGLVLDKKFNGDLSKVQDRNPLKETSLATLAKDGKLKVDPTTLSSWIKAAALARWFEKNNNPLDNFTTSHFVALLPLEDEVKRGELAIEANNSGMSVRDLQKRVKTLKGGTGTIDYAKQILAKLGNGKALLADENLKRVLSSKTMLLSELSGPDREEIEAEIEAAKENFHAYAKVLDDALEKLLEIKAEIEASKSLEKVA